MTERGILFSAPMVRALLDGTKMQTRRAVKRQPWASCSIEEGGTGESPFVYSALNGAGPGHDVDESRTPCVCPYGRPGDRLWVRETWAPHPDFPESVRRCVYRADPECKYDVPRWRPSIHMPRWASRILLEITGVRVERLQDISDQDAIAEGIGLNASAAGVPMTTPAGETMPRAMYRDLWESINGAGSWDANPWVWVVEFKRVQS